MTKLIQTYEITAWCDRTFGTEFAVEAESPEQALQFAREQVNDEEAEACDDLYRWDTFRIADAAGVEQLAWEDEEVHLHRGATALLDACRLVTERWVRGDLAEAARACAAAVALATGNAAGPVKRTVTIVVQGGVVHEASNLPPGWDYEVIDHDANA
jgi:hypothetical protein